MFQHHRPSSRDTLGGAVERHSSPTLTHASSEQQHGLQRTIWDIAAEHSGQPAEAIAAALEPLREARRRLSRRQRQAMLHRAERELGRATYRFSQGERGGVWSDEDYRRIRAAVQDASGRAAICLLYLLGSRQAVTLAEGTDPRLPETRRRIALAYALARAPGSELGADVKLGLARGLFEKVLADPNNSALWRERQNRPSKRTISDDLTWLHDRRVLHRWQVPAHAAAPSEMKRGSAYPTNRYWAPVDRTPDTMLDVARALGDIPPNEAPRGPWTEAEHESVAEIRAILLEEFGIARPEARGDPPS